MATAMKQHCKLGRLLYSILVLGSIAVPLHGLQGAVQGESGAEPDGMLPLLTNYLKCNLCETRFMEGKVSDCNCDFQTVNQAVSKFFKPKLYALSNRYDTRTHTAMCATQFHYLFLCYIYMN